VCVDIVTQTAVGCCGDGVVGSSFV